MGSFPRHSSAVVAALFASGFISFAAETEKVRNDRVVAWESKLEPGEKLQSSSDEPTLLLYLGEGTLDLSSREGTKARVKTQPGKVRFDPHGVTEIRNGGSSALPIVRVEFKSTGSRDHWGSTGLSSHYKVLLENEYVRVYDIVIPAETNEPQHTHRDRIVVCLFSAELTHLFADGKTETSSLKTGEIVWRKGSTHIGQNHSDKGFHAIAIEPK
jgi:hypothetical protein